MAKCKTDVRGCCCNVDGECTYWGSCHNQIFENTSININEFIELKELNNRR